MSNCVTVRKLKKVSNHVLVDELVMFNNLSNKQIIFYIFIIAFIIRFIFAYISYKGNVMANFVDDKAYMHYAENVIEQGPLVLDYQKLGFIHCVGPGLPWLMALMMKIFGKGWFSLFILNAFIGSFTCILVYFLGKEIFNKRVGIWAALWSTIYVLFIKYVATSGKEIWMTFLFTSIVLLIIKLSKKENRKLTVCILAFLFAFLIHVDERYFSYFFLILLSLIFLRIHDLKKGLKDALYFFLIVIVLMTPWLIRNYYVYNKIVILTVRTTTLTDKLFGYPKDEFTKSIGVILSKEYLNKAQIDSVLLGLKTTHNNGKQISSEQIEAMKDGMLPHSFSKIEGYWSILQRLWRPVNLKRSYSKNGFYYESSWSLRHNLSIGLTYGVLLPFAVFGLILLFYKRRKLGIFLLSILFLHTIIHVLIAPFTVNRYRIPIDSIIIVLGIYGMIIVYNKVKSNILLKSESNKPYLTK